MHAQLELLKSHDADPSPGLAVKREPPGPPPTQSPLAPPVNGYDHLSLAAQDAARALASKTDVDAHIHPDLRARPTNLSAPAAMMPLAPPTGHSPGPAPTGPPNPNIAPAPPASTPMVLDESPNDGRKTKRELSQSKRAAQNRAAQRAFRQRKEGYIKKLEQQVRDFMDMEQSHKVLQSENYALREYVIHLQSRLLDSQGEYPQPPPNINLSQPPPPQPSVVTPSPLEAIAQAVAELPAQEQAAERQLTNPAYKGVQGTEDTRTADEINRQLQPEEAPEHSPSV